MIFVTLGSQKFQFNRLLIALDEQISSGKINEKVFAQVGMSDYKPQRFQFIDFLNQDEFAREMDSADIVITHGGTGAIIGAVKKNKKVIAVPRLAKYGEHVDDHQIQIIEQFQEQNLICGCLDCNEIWKAIEMVKKIDFEEYHSNTFRIIESIEEFIEKK